jgi:hypothetical protein
MEQLTIAHLTDSKKDFKVYTKTKEQYNAVLQIAEDNGYKEFDNASYTGMGLEGFKQVPNYGIAFFPEGTQDSGRTNGNFITDGDSEHTNWPKGCHVDAEAFIQANKPA